MLSGNIHKSIQVTNREKHGDFDGYNKACVSNLCMHLGFIPYVITYGYLHSCAVDETNGIKMIRGGSLAGSGDSYTPEKRLSGRPSQMVCVCDKTKTESIGYTATRLTNCQR